MKQYTKLIYLFFIMGVFLIPVNSCKKADQPVILSTVEITNITQSEAKTGGRVPGMQSVNLTAAGICWSLTANPTISDSHSGTEIDNMVNSFECTIFGLIPNTTYFVRAFATNSTGTYYGNEISFKTMDIINNCGTVTDIDSNIYNTVSIGSQCWMKENLKTTKYRDGTAIPNVIDDTEWSTTTSGSYCNLNDIVSNSNINGKLYNWYAVADTRNLCPVGWHVATDADWVQLYEYLGEEAAGKMAAARIGIRFNNGTYQDNGSFWWSSTENNPFDAWSCYLYPGEFIFHRINYSKNYGFSVRCVKDI